MIKKTGYLLIICGSAIVLLSNKIVFPGLEYLLGIETIVGKHNVRYLDDGGYGYTNPAAMMMWIGSVVLIGILIAIAGVYILRNSGTKSGKHRLDK